MKIRSIPCEFSDSCKGWTIFYGKKLVGFVLKMQDGDFKYLCESYSEYGPSFYTNSKKEGIQEMIDKI